MYFTLTRIELPSSKSRPDSLHRRKPRHFSGRGADRGRWRYPGHPPEPGLREESEPEAPPDGIGKDAPAGLLQGTAPRYGRGASG